MKNIKIKAWAILLGKGKYQNLWMSDWERNRPRIFKTKKKAKELYPGFLITSCEITLKVNKSNK